jgi:hypothetical protein
VQCDNNTFEHSYQHNTKSTLVTQMVFAVLGWIDPVKVRQAETENTPG